MNKICFLVCTETKKDQRFNVSPRFVILYVFRKPKTTDLDRIQGVFGTQSKSDMY